MSRQILRRPQRSSPRPTKSILSSRRKPNNISNLRPLTRLSSKQSSATHSRRASRCQSRFKSNLQGSPLPNKIQLRVRWESRLRLSLEASIVARHLLYPLLEPPLLAWLTLLPQWALQTQARAQTQLTSSSLRSRPGASEVNYAEISFDQVRKNQTSCANLASGRDLTAFDTLSADVLAH